MGRAAPPGQLVGSSAGQLPSYAHCPVIVVREPPDDQGGPIVVGVDGSSASEAALGFGFEEAALRGRPLLAMYGCWTDSAIEPADTDLFTGLEEPRRAASTTLERTVSP
jgi:nucleotide-binding universal stress UspA family protein